VWAVWGGEVRGVGGLGLEGGEGGGYMTRAAFERETKVWMPIFSFFFWFRET
jgi:hypothetical protein